MRDADDEHAIDYRLSSIVLETPASNVIAPLL